MRYDFRPIVASCRLAPVAAQPDVESALVSFFGRRLPFALESSGPDLTYGRFTIVGADPVHIVSIDRTDPRPLDRLAEAVGRFPAGGDGSGGPFAGGWVGYVSYEAGLTIEGVPPAAEQDVALPAVRFALYDTVAVFDRVGRQWYAVGVDWPTGCGVDRPPLAERLAEVGRVLETTASMPPATMPKLTCPPPRPTVERDAYLAAVGRAKQYIEAGDVYQVNLAQRFSTTTRATALDLYRRLRLANPSAFAALLQWDDQAVISSSPELFLDFRDGRVLTRPIKGTRPRIGDPALDAVRRRELIESPKDRAELTMIVDLLRNDLGRVCQFGSIRVLSPAELEEHPTVYHLVGTVEGRLRPECDWADLLRACFPGGSITGAPKIRAMQIISELEPVCRGAYCGAIGYIGLDGSMCLNVAIRTMVLDGGDLHLFAGGGIVADSDPADEYDETLAKAAGMLRALGHAGIAERAALATESGG